MFMGVDSKLFDWICWLCCVTFIFRRFVGCSMHPVSPVTGSKPCFGQKKRVKSATLGYVKMPIPTTRGRSMLTKVHGRLSGWLAGLALYPVVGWGQEVLIHPQNVTVCWGEEAVFNSTTRAGFGGWYINGIEIDIFLTPEEAGFVRPTKNIDGSGSSRRTDLTLRFLSSTPIYFSGVNITSAVFAHEGSAVSEVAYLFYKTNQQFPVTSLSSTVTGTTAQFNWDGQGNHIHYIFGIYDGNNNQIANQTTVTTHASFDLPPRVNGTCQSLEFRVTGVEVQYPECPDIEQTRYSVYLYIKPDISPVTAQLDSNNNGTVLVSWVSDGDSTNYWVSITDLDRGNQTQVAYRGDPPFSYTPALCGQYNLNVSVSPAECAEEPEFTHSDTIHFTIPCPTTATEPTETEIPDQPSGTQASFPSLLLAVAAIIPLLRWQH